VSKVLLQKKRVIKKVQTKFEKVAIETTHQFNKSGNGFKQSPLLQELILATTSEKPYSISKELLSTYLDIDINEMQLYRITTHYGEALAPVLEATKLLNPLSNKEDCLYAQADGSMILTREEKWKKVKLGRIFCAKSCLQVEGKVNSIKASQYVSHFGNHKAFTQKMETVLNDYGNLKKQLIFITDGAV
jgi:hypothetical protein